MDGAAPDETTNELALVAVPEGVTMVMGPVVAATGTVATTSLPKTTNAAARPLNWTEVALLRLAPERVTLVPGTPEAGEKPDTAGAVPWAALSTVNTVALWAVPSGFVTEMGPVVAPAGTVAKSEL